MFGVSRKYVFETVWVCYLSKMSKKTIHLLDIWSFWTLIKDVVCITYYLMHTTSLIYEISVLTCPTAPMKEMDVKLDKFSTKKRSILKLIHVLQMKLKGQACVVHVLRVAIKPIMP